MMDSEKGTSAMEREKPTSSMPENKGSKHVKGEHNERSNISGATSGSSDSVPRAMPEMDEPTIGGKIM